MKLIKNYICLLVFIVGLLLSEEALAQQTFITVPSPDILPPGNLMLKGSFRFRPFEPDTFTRLSPSATYGIGFGSEITAGVNTTIREDTDVNMDLQVKKVFTIVDTTKLTVGSRLLPNLKDNVSPQNFTYSHVSTQLKRVNTRLLSGIYVANRNKSFLPDKVGVILGLEQPVTDKLRIALDWTSRNESYGNLAVGAKYRPVPTVSITGGILIPNGGRSKLAFLVSISKYFQ